MCGRELNLAAFAHSTTKLAPGSTHHHPLSVRCIVWSWNAVLDGGLNLLNILLQTALRASGRDRVASGISFARDSALCCLVFACGPSLSTTELQNGRRNPFLTTGKCRSVDGIVSIGYDKAHAGWLSRLRHSLCWALVFVDKRERFATGMDHRLHAAWLLFPDHAARRDGRFDRRLRTQK